MVAALTVLGVLLAIVTLRGGYGSLGAVGAKSDARRLVMDLQQCRRRAIATGDDHYLQLTTAGYQMYRRSGGDSTAVDDYRPFSTGVSILTTSNTLEFNFEGQALTGYVVTLSSGNTSWTATVVPVTGSVSLVENP